ncbi:hypothetical protein GJ496_005442 [Pomphorhynchus laevis]|nr:hypothetical protein GJ496_005442 [Pomphorhynchus laevis]
MCSNPSVAKLYGNAKLTLETCSTKVDVKKEAYNVPQPVWTKHVNIEGKTYYCHNKSGKILKKRPFADQIKNEINDKQKTQKIAEESKLIGKWEPVIEHLPSSLENVFEPKLDLPKLKPVQPSSLPDELFQSDDELDRLESATRDEKTFCNDFIRQNKPQMFKKLYKLYRLNCLPASLHIDICKQNLKKDTHRNLDVKEMLKLLVDQGNLTEVIQK